MRTQKQSLCGVIRRILCAGMVLCSLVMCASWAYADALDDDLASQWERRDIPARMGTPEFTAAERFSVGLLFGVDPTDDYFTYFPIAVDAAYWFTEMWALHLRGTLLMARADSSLSEFMSEHSHVRDISYLREAQRGDVELLGSFHPVYGKSTVSTTNLWGFTWGIFAGIGVNVSESPNGERTKTEIGAHAEGIVGTEFSVFALDWLAICAEASLRFYHAPKQWVLPGTFSIGVRFFLPKLWGGESNE